jgi:hypothetical protein
VSVVANIAKGKVAEYAARVNASDPANSAIIIVALKAAGLEADSVLQDYDTLAAVLAAANDEATNVGYARIVLDQAGGITITVDDTADENRVTTPEQTWNSVAAAGGAWGKLAWCYDADTTAGTDTDIIPLCFMDFTVTPDGNDIVSTTFSTDGFFFATNP